MLISTVLFRDIDPVARFIVKFALLEPLNTPVPVTVTVAVPAFVLLE